MEPLIKLRKELHKNAEYAFKEEKTKKILAEYIKKHSPDKIHDNMAGTGRIYDFTLGTGSGNHLMIRADMDALLQPNGSAAHLCGHDGHMTMSLSVLEYLEELKQKYNGVLSILFQPAEETGAGAIECVEYMKQNQIKPDAIIGLHNLPEEKLGTIAYKKGTFACGSLGLEVLIEGHTSHASHPENALNPILNFEEFRTQLEKEKSVKPGDFFLNTITHMELGAPSFGITPGQMKLFITLRAETESRLEELNTKVHQLIKSTYPPPFKVTISEHDIFPVTRSSESLVALISQLKDQKTYVLKEPMRWSEDFGHYSKLTDTLFFGLGSELKTPLHHPDFVFNDQLIPFATVIYRDLAQNFFEKV